jgi:hypothetical protein
VSPRTRDLEVRYRWISVGMVMLFGSAFALGLVLYVVDHGGRSSALVLHGGLAVLMASPVVRLLVGAAERIRRRDWPFLAMTGVIVLEIVIVLWRAGTKS